MSDCFCSYSHAFHVCVKIQEVPPLTAVPCTQSGTMCEVTKTKHTAVANNGETDKAAKRKLPPKSLKDKLRDMVAVSLACVVMLNMASAAFIELVAWAPFHRLVPEVSHRRRVLGLVQEVLHLPRMTRTSR